MRQLAPLFGVSKSAADRITDRPGPMLALQPRQRFAKDTVLIVDGTLVPTREHTVAERSKNYRYSTNHQVVLDADTRLVVVAGRPLAGNRNDCKAWEESGAKAAAGRTLTIVDGGYPGTGLVIPYRRERGQAELPAWKGEHNKSHKQVRARVEHVFARMRAWKILRDCRLKGDGVHHAMLGIARMYNLALAGWASRPHGGRPCPRRPEDHLRDSPWVADAAAGGGADDETAGAFDASQAANHAVVVARVADRHQAKPSRQVSVEDRSRGGRCGVGLRHGRR